MANPSSFIEQLDAKSLEVFNEAIGKPCSDQAIFFLNAFWHEYGDQAEFVYSVTNKIFRMADMQSKGIQYIHLYDEGKSLDFDMGIYFFEQLCKFVEEPTHKFFQPYGLVQWYDNNKHFKEEYSKSLPEMMTSIARKKELRDKVDVNFDGRVSLLEYLLYQYNASPKDLVDRSVGHMEIHEEIRKAMDALAEVQARIRAYEAEKQRLEDGNELPGVKGLRFKNELAQLNSSPLWEAINVALITAEAAVRIATRNFGGGASAAALMAGIGENTVSETSTDGAIFWMNRELQEQKAKYGPKKAM